MSIWTTFSAGNYSQVLFLRANPLAATLNGYMAFIDNTNRFIVTTLWGDIMNFPATYADGCGIGLRAIGPIIYAYFRPALSPTWAELGSVYNNRHSVGHAGFWLHAADDTVDDFGGGSLILTATPSPATFTLGSVAPNVSVRAFRTWALRPRSFAWRCHDVRHP